MNERPGPESCPLPLADYPRVILAHGGGGRLMHRLIEEFFLRAFGNPVLDARLDRALLDPPRPGARLAFTTDSYVVSPLFFPGGDIGRLAVWGTVNGDLGRHGIAVMAARHGLSFERGIESDCAPVAQPGCEGAKRIGEVRAGRAGRARLRGLAGEARSLVLPAAEQLPRIC